MGDGVDGAFCYIRWSEFLIAVLLFVIQETGDYTTIQPPGWHLFHLPDKFPNLQVNVWCPVGNKSGAWWAGGC